MFNQWKTSLRWCMQEFSNHLICLNPKKPASLRSSDSTFEFNAHISKFNQQPIHRIKPYFFSFSVHKKRSLHPFHCDFNVSLWDLIILSFTMQKTGITYCVWAFFSYPFISIQYYSYSMSKTSIKAFFVVLITCIIKYLHLLYHTFSSLFNLKLIHTHSLCPSSPLRSISSPSLVSSANNWLGEVMGRFIWVSSVPSIRIRKDQSAVSYCHGFPWASGSDLFCFLSFYCIWASDMTHYRQSIHANICLKSSI